MHSWRIVGRAALRPSPSTLAAARRWSGTSGGSGLFSSLRDSYAKWEQEHLGGTAAQDADIVGDAGTTTSAPLRIGSNPLACPRSVLFVPGSKPRAMEKIPQLPADLFVLDLEDSVGPGSKREAREYIRNFVSQLHRQEIKHRLVVRVNSPDYDSANALLDMELVGELGKLVEGVAFPKTTTRTYDLVKDLVHPDHQLWAFFESPISVMEAPLICAQRKYRYAVMGYNDLAAELGLPLAATSGATPTPGDADAAAMHLVGRLPLLQSSCHVLTCARAYQMYVLDGVYNQPSDTAGFARDLRICRALGFNGKTLIHPSQVGPTNAAYAPTQAEVDWAHRVGAAVAQAGGSVATVDGKMVEELHVRQAKRVIDLHNSIQLEEEERASRGNAEGSSRVASPPSRRAPYQGTPP